MAEQEPTQSQAQPSSQYADFTQQLGKSLVEAIQQAQEAQVQALKQLRESLERVLPAAPSSPAPGAELFPAPESVARANFALMEQLLQAQKQYTLGLLDALAPARDKPPGSDTPSA